MFRIAGVNIPSNKHVWVGLTSLYGIGKTSALMICRKADINPCKKINTLTDDEVITIRQIIDSDYKVEGDLKKEVSLNIKRLVDLAAYRGLRHRKRLPVRGQRTRTNAKTRKGKSPAIAAKKKVTK